jgi:hypothetical protein
MPWKEYFVAKHNIIDSTTEIWKNLLGSTLQVWMIAF